MKSIISILLEIYENESMAHYYSRFVCETSNEVQEELIIGDRFIIKNNDYSNIQWSEKSKFFNEFILVKTLNEQQFRDLLISEKQKAKETFKL